MFIRLKNQSAARSVNTDCQQSYIIHLMVSLPLLVDMALISCLERAFLTSQLWKLIVWNFWAVWGKSKTQSWQTAYLNSKTSCQYYTTTYRRFCQQCRGRRRSRSRSLSSSRWSVPPWCRCTRSCRTSQNARGCGTPPCPPWCLRRRSSSPSDGRRAYSSPAGQSGLMSAHTKLLTCRASGWRPEPVVYLSGHGPLGFDHSTVHFMRPRFHCLVHFAHGRVCDKAEASGALAAGFPHHLQTTQWHTVVLKGPLTWPEACLQSTVVYYGLRPSWLRLRWRNTYHAVGQRPPLFKMGP